MSDGQGAPKSEGADPAGTDGFGGDLVTLTDVLSSYSSTPNPPIAALEQVISERNALSSQNSLLWKLLENQRSVYDQKLERVRSERDTLKAKLTSLGEHPDQILMEQGTNKRIPPETTLRPSSSHSGLRFDDKQKVIAPEDPGQETTITQSKDSVTWTHTTPSPIDPAPPIVPTSAEPLGHFPTPPTSHFNIQPYNRPQTSTFPPALSAFTTANSSLNTLSTSSGDQLRPNHPTNSSSQLPMLETKEDQIQTNVVEGEFVIVDESVGGDVMGSEDWLSGRGLEESYPSSRNTEDFPMPPTFHPSVAPSVYSLSVVPDIRSEYTVNAASSEVDLAASTVPFQSSNPLTINRPRKPIPPSEYHRTKGGDKKQSIQYINIAPNIPKISGPIGGAPIPLGYIFGARGKAKPKTFRALGRPNEQSPAPVQPKVFGTVLEESLQVAQIANLPAIVFRCIQYIESKGADKEEGIYRLSGSAAVIRRLKDRFNSEGDVDLLASDEYWDPHAIAGLLKIFMRELPTTLLTRELHTRFLSLIDFVDAQERIKELTSLISQLPLANYSLLRALTAHLILIVQNSNVNKMTIRNVGIVFSPTLGIPAGVFSLMLGEFNRVFSVDDPGTLGEEEDGQ